MKFSVAFASLLSLAAASPAVRRDLPTTMVAGVEVVDTPLVRDARAIIEKFTPFLYKHCMRTWLFGAAAINANATLMANIDREVHAVSTILHDLGWDMTPNSPWVSPDKRFEIDGALGAVKFITTNKHFSKAEWPDYRLEKVHDGIALHVSPGLQYGKNADVMNTLTSIALDNPGMPSPTIPTADYDNIVKAFPNFDIGTGTNTTWVWLATTKPIATYDNPLQPFGEAFVPGYNPVGARIFDFINPNFTKIH